METSTPPWTTTSPLTRISSTSSSPKTTRFRADLGSSRPPGPGLWRQGVNSVLHNAGHLSVATAPILREPRPLPRTTCPLRRPHITSGDCHPCLMRRILTCPPLPHRSRRSRHLITEHPEPDISTSTALPASGAGVHGSAGSAPNSPHGGHRRQSTEPDHLSQDGKAAGQLLDEIAAQRRTLLDRLASG